jgi:hypothetical protein
MGYVDFLDFAVLEFLRGAHDVSGDYVWAFLFDVDRFFELDFAVEDYVKLTHLNSLLA